MAGSKPERSRLTRVAISLTTFGVCVWYSVLTPAAGTRTPINFPQELPAASLEQEQIELTIGGIATDTRTRGHTGRHLDDFRVVRARKERRPVVHVLLSMLVAVVLAALCFGGYAMMGEEVGEYDSHNSWEDKVMDPDALDEITKILEEVPLMKRLSSEDRANIARICKRNTYKKDTVLVKQGDIGDLFYIITAGDAQVIARCAAGQEVRTVNLSAGDSFGENALLYEEPRGATVTASTELVVLSIAADDFIALGVVSKLKVVQRKAVIQGKTKLKDTGRKSSKRPAVIKSEAEREFLWASLRKTETLKPILAEVTTKRVGNLVDAAWKETIRQGEEIIKCGDVNADYAYVIEEGDVEVINPNEVGDKGVATSTPKLHRGACFGEIALLYMTPRTRTIRALTDAVVWTFDRSDFKEMMMGSANDKNEEYAKYLDKVDILDCLATEEKKELANALVKLRFSKGELILKQGDVGSAFYILTEGAVSVTADGKDIGQLRATNASDAHYFGERALIEQKPRSATVKVDSDHVNVLALDKGSFELLLGSLTCVMKEGINHYELARKMKSKECVRSDSGKVEFSDLVEVGMLGCGAFGSVSLYVHASTDEPYALKQMSKGAIVKNGMQEQVMHECTVLRAISSSYIVRLHAAYNWPNVLALLLEPLLGGELQTIYTRNLLYGSVPHARYYTACVIFAFEYMHKKHILYRDLKPENIVLNSAGIAKVTDLGLAKQSVGKTYTLCGTPEYLAPEVILSVGHGQAVDWWTLGIFTFELMTGTTPFRAPQVKDIIVKATAGVEKVRFPMKCQGPVRELIESLLQQRPERRLPMRAGGVANIRRHPWYVNFDWSGVEDGNPSAVPFKPTVSDSKDLSNFEAVPNNLPQDSKYFDDGSGWDAAWEF